MKLRLPFKLRPSAAYALLMVLVMVSIAALVLAGTMNRTYTTSRINDRNYELVVGQNAAEAAVEKAMAQLRYYFLNSGLAGVNINSNSIASSVPSSSENSYWSKFEFSDGQGRVGRTYIGQIATYFGPLPSQFPGLTTISNSPIYRIVSNVRQPNGLYPGLTNAVQEDVLLAYIPVFQYAIFYNSLLEFTKAATFTINGRVHANGPIYTGSSSPLTFNGKVTTTGSVSSPAWAGMSPPYSYTGTYSGGLATNDSTVTLPLGTNNVHAIIDMPPVGESLTNTLAQQRLYNEANMIVLVSNTTVSVILQASQNGLIPAADTSKITLGPYTNSVTFLRTNFPFLTITNTFTDQREGKTILASQVDIGKLKTWFSTNGSIAAKFPSASGTYPALLYIADNRTNSSSQLSAVRITNGIALPVNGGFGFSVATPNPLYVWGNYNCTNSSYLATTNTSATVPSALLSDALTILSSSWQDSQSSGSYSSRNAANDTINAAIVTGVVYSTGPNLGQYSGGVHNLPRLLENWSGDNLWLNTSIVNLFASTKATHQLIDPGQAGNYYGPPTRHFSYDLNYLNPARQPPPGTPYLSVFLRWNWATPPPNTLTYNVTP